MKTFFIVGGVLVLLIAFVLILLSFTSRKIETPQYRVLKTIDEVEIRQYPAMLVAQTTMSDSGIEKGMNNGFRTIAAYIFGENENNQKIAMTAPVVVKIGDTSTMFFVMPSSYKKNELPRPSSDKVKISEETEKILAVVTFGGYSSDQKIAKHRQKLENTLRQHQLKTIGSFLYMGYNAPWDILNRRNEVAIEVQWQDK